MIKKILWVVLGLSLGLNMGLLYGRFAVRSDPMPPPPGGRPGPGSGRFEAEPPVERIVADQLRVTDRHLQLDDAQEQAVRRILEERMPDLAGLRRETRQANQAMARIFAAEDFDAEAFRRQADRARWVRSRADSLSALILSEEAAVFDAHQRRLFAEQGPLGGQQAPLPPHPGPGRDRLDR